MRYPADYPAILASKIDTIITVDCETTGFDPWRCEILTLSISAMDYSTLRRKDSIELTFRPRNLPFWDYVSPEAIARAEKRKKPIKKASEVHGISLSQALYFDDKASSTKKALSFIEDHCRRVPQILLCHALDMFQSLNYFDVSMMMAHFEKFGLREELYRNLRFFESTETYFREARRRGYYQRTADLFSGSLDQEEGDDYKLDTLCRVYKIPLNHHSAKSDREACEELYRKARSLGSNEEESTFDLSGSSNENGVSGRESLLGELYTRPRWLENPDNGTSSEQAVHVCQEES